MIQKAGTQSCIYNTSATLEKKMLRKNVQKDIHPHGNNSCLCDKITECVRLLFAFSTPSGMDGHYLYNEKSSRASYLPPKPRLPVRPGEVGHGGTGPTGWSPPRQLDPAPHQQATGGGSPRCNSHFEPLEVGESPADHDSLKGRGRGWSAEATGGRARTDQARSPPGASAPRCPRPPRGSDLSDVCRGSGTPQEI